MLLASSERITRLNVTEQKCILVSRSENSLYHCEETNILFEAIRFGFELLND